jgi:Papain-like cysteine protease AvrRpt2
MGNTLRKASVVAFFAALFTMLGAILAQTAPAAKSQPGSSILHIITIRWKGEVTDDQRLQLRACMRTAFAQVDASKLTRYWLTDPASFPLSSVQGEGFTDAIVLEFPDSAAFDDYKKGGVAQKALYDCDYLSKRSRSLTHDITSLISLTVSPIKQPGTNTTWAAAAAMLAMQRDASLQTVDAVIAKAGDPFRAMLQGNQNLLVKDLRAFLDGLKFSTIIVDDFDANRLASLLSASGPLWIAATTGADVDAAKFSVHARILRAISGDGSDANTTVTVIDPEAGTESMVTLGTFRAMFKDKVMVPDLGSATPTKIQLIYSRSSGSMLSF